MSGPRGTELTQLAAAHEARRSPAAPLPAVALQRIHAGARSTVEDVLQAALSGAGAVAVNTVQTGEDSTARGIVQAVISGDAPDYYFHLLPLEPPDGIPQDGAAGRELSSAAPLRPGRSYLVRAEVSRNPFASGLTGGGFTLKQTPVKRVRDLRLLLEPQDSAVARAAIAAMEGGYAFLPQAATEWRHEFRVTLRPDAAVERIGFVLKYREAGSAIELPAATLELPVAAPGAPLRAEDAVDLLPAPVAGALSLAANARPPEGTAILEVQPADGDQLQLTGWRQDRAARPVGLEPIARPLEGDDVPEEDYLRTLRQTAHRLSVANRGNVAAWLEEVLQRYGDRSCIVVLDQADSQVPWEMITLSGGRYLGTHALVVRWIEAQIRGQPVSTRLEETVHAGRVAAFVAPAMAGATEQKLPLPAVLAPAPFESPDDLKWDLLPGEGVAPVGLAYLSADGPLLYGDEAAADEAALERLRGRYPSAVEVDFDDVEGLLDPRPAFFVNAPYSARVWRGRDLCGLAHAILTQVASAYLGTLGPIDPLHAAEMAQRLLEAAGAPGGVQPAAFLRELRAEAVARLLIRGLSAEARRQAERRLLHTFNYVYYGSPWARLEVTGRPAADAPETQP